RSHDHYRANPDSQAGADLPLHHCVRRASQVPKNAIANAPEHAAEDVVDGKSGMPDAGSARGCRHDSAGDCEEPAQEDRRAPALAEHRASPFGAAPDPAKCLGSKQAITHPLADLVTDERPGNGSDHDDENQQRQRHVPATGEYAAEYRRDFARQHEAYEDSRLPEYERRDYQVSNPAVQVDQAAGERTHSGSPSPHGGRPRACDRAPALPGL